MFSYAEALARLFQMSHSQGLPRDLSTTLQFAQILGHPERAFPVVHVAGTNGKGSVTFKIARALEYAGLKTGLYTSPHISTFRERILVSGQPISEREAAEELTEIFSHLDRAQLQPTYFETATFLAFNYFRKQQVDIAVIETGLGGRCDATNVVDPLLTVITSISHDHTAVLGETLEEIAAEKAGIIKPGIPLVIGPRARFQAIQERAKELDCPLIEASHSFGFYDKENRQIAERALHFLTQHFALTPPAIEKGISERPVCRFEVQGEVILDVAHNPDGFRQLVLAMEENFPGRPYRAFLGMSKEKECRACLKHLVPKAQHIHLVDGFSDRALPVREIEKMLVELGYRAFTAEQSISAGVSQARALAQGRGELVLICGSFYIMRAVREALGLSFPQDPI